MYLTSMKETDYERVMSAQIKSKTQGELILSEIKNKIEKIVKLMEAEPQIKRIEKSLDFFYYPLKYYLDGAVTKDRNEQNIEDTACYRHLARKKTREQFEKLRDKNYLLNEESQEDYYLLLRYVTNDIVLLENTLITRFSSVAKNHNMDVK